MAKKAASSKAKPKKAQVAAKDPFTHWGTDVLRNPTEQVSPSYLKTPAFKALITKMRKAMEGVGVGLAANQIGVAKAIAIIEINPTKNRPNAPKVPPTTIVNPKIQDRSAELQYGWEGCLSCGGPFFFVPRAKWIKVFYLDGNTGRAVTRTISDFEAVVFQHEIDHLNGKICGERVLVVNGEVAKGAIIHVEEYRKNPHQIPEGARHLVKG